MRDGIEYEFDVCGEMDQENTLVITKTRCPKLASGVFAKPGRELADTLKDWLRGTAVQRTETISAEPRTEPAESPTNVPPEETVSVTRKCEASGLSAGELASIW